MFRALFALVVLMGAAATSVAYWTQAWWQKPIALTSSVDFEVREGSTLQSVSNELTKLKMITVDPRLFEFSFRLSLPRSTVKAGDYRFEGSLSPQKIAAILSSGQTITTSFTIPEGWNTFQIAERLEKVFPKTNKFKWLRLMRDPKFLSNLPGSPQSVEGFLFPETYTFNPRATPRDVINEMIQTFKKHLTSEIIAKGEAKKLKPLEIVTLASIIEKETGKAAERPHISSVFHNRMRIGMRLQTDPTVIYGMWERYDGNIRKTDLKTPTAYNTYVIPGLPPGPIASPGLAALKAAVDPIESKDLYFVSRGDGSHIFSTNLRDHQKGVYQYQIQPSRNGSSRN